MQSRTQSRTSTIEQLENRRLCSASVIPAAVHRIPPFPIVIGTYDGTAVFTNGASTAERLTITKQKNGIFSGMTYQANGANGKVTGSVSRLKKVHFVDRGTTVKFVSVGNGTFFNNTFTIRFVATQAGHALRGTLTVTNIAPV